MRLYKQNTTNHLKKKARKVKKGIETVKDTSYKGLAKNFLFAEYSKNEEIKHCEVAFVQYTYFM